MNNIKKFSALAIATTFFCCSSLERDNPYDQKASNSILKSCNYVFNHDTSFCYDGEIYDLCGGMEYNPTAYFCEESVAHIAKCSGAEYNPLNQRCSLDYIVETKCGVYWYNAKDTSLRCQNNVLETRCINNSWYNSITHYCSKNSVGKYLRFTDTRDGKIYRYVIIGTQAWMAENLNYETNYSKCYLNQDSYCATYGRLYDWTTAMKACPDGWHLPSQDEWDSLTSYIENEKNCSNCDAKYLKATNGWDNNYNGTNDYGFTALPSGGWGGVGSLSHWWSTDSNNYRDLHYDYNSTKWYTITYISNGVDLFSVRCVRDN